MYIEYWCWATGVHYVNQTQVKKERSSFRSSVRIHPKGKRNVKKVGNTVTSVTPPPSFT